MQRIDRNIHAALDRDVRGIGPDQTARPTLPFQTVVSERLLVILASGVLAVAGPVLLNTIAQASFASVQVLLEFCHVGLVAFQIFGR